MYNNTDIRNGFYGTVHYDSDGNESYFEERGKQITLEKAYSSIEDGEVIWEVSFTYMGQRKRFEIQRNSIAEKKLASFLQGKGADVTAKSFNCFVDSMRLQEDALGTVSNTFNRLGWIKVPHNGSLEYCYRYSELIGSINAKYAGNLSMTPKGSLEDWTEMVRSQVLGRPQLETILLAALSAPIVGIHGINTTTDNPIYHINFASGKGKSTVCYLATSVSGEPFDGMRVEYDQYGVMHEKGSIYGSWGATPKATISSHAGNRGVVAILNELGKFGGTDMTQTVFNLSEGSDIKRLTPQLQSVITEGFNTAFISCGEMSLIDRCKSKLEGIKNRVMEISVPMTESADHARRIKDGCVANNGFAAPMIAEYILNNGGFEMVQGLYREILEELTATAPQGVSDRYIEKFPVFLVMAARLAKDALDLDFDIASVVKFCYDCVAESNEENGEISKSFDEIVETFNIHADNFFDNDRPNHIPKVVWGKIVHSQRVEKNQQLVREYLVYPNKLRALLKEKGYPNPATELKIWRDKGALDVDVGHLTKKGSFKIGNNVEPRMYILQVWKDVQPTPQKASKIPLLLKDDDDDASRESNREVASNEHNVT